LVALPNSEVLHKEEEVPAQKIIKNKKRYMFMEIVNIFQMGGGKSTQKEKGFK
jgi:hypothetical protein